MWTLHSLWRKELEISRADYLADKFTAVQRYALIAGWVGSGTTACPPPEGDWMTSAPWLQATRGIRGRRRTWGQRFRDAVAQRTRQLVLVHPHRSPTRSPWPAGREHTAVVLRLARGRLSPTTSRVRSEPGPNVAPMAAIGALTGAPQKVKSHFGICGPILGPVPVLGPCCAKAWLAHLRV